MTTPAMNRRDFLKSTTVAGLTAGTINVVAPAQVRGSEANGRVRVACIGQGGRGAMITKMVHEHAGLEVTAVADYFPEVAAEGANRVGLPQSKAFSGLRGYQRAIDTGVDAVVLQTPPYFFPEHSEAAVQAGCHVYVAKPVAVDVPGCLTIAELGRKATENQRVFHVDFQWRYLPYLVECLNHIRAGKMGDIRFVRAFYNDEGREDISVKNDISELFRGLRWAMSRELGGDRIVSAGIHAIDTALLIIGSRPNKACGVVQRSRKNPINSATDTASLTYSFPGGVVMNYSGDQFRNYHSDIDMFSGVKSYADGGHMQTFYGQGVTSMRHAKWRYEGGENPALYTWGAQHNVDLFHQCIDGGNYANTTVAGAVDANLTCLLGAEAGRAGSEMTWEELLAKGEKIEIDLSRLKS
jgi:predicted dehydrogenase